MLTKKEIIKQLKNEKIFLGKDPNRTFDYYDENGLLPKSVGYRQQSPLYPEHTPWVIKDILIAQQVGNEARAGLITSAWHMKRAQRLARLNGLQLEPLPADFHTPPVIRPTVKDFVPSSTASDTIRRALKEYMAWLVGR